MLFHILQMSEVHAPDRLRRELSLDHVRAEANGRDTVAAQPARRQLHRALMQTAQYEPRRYLESHDFARAEVVLRVARWLDADDGNVCWLLALSLAQFDRPRVATEMIECALRAGQLTSEALRREPLLQPLRGRPGWDDLLRRVDGSVR